MKLLIVDDEIDVVETLSLHFKRKGFEVSSCSTGEEAVKLLLEAPQDIVLLDYKLDGSMNGLDVLKKIRESGSNVKVIFLTGALNGDIREKVENLGVEVFLNKPILLHTLNEAIEGNLKN